MMSMMFSQMISVVEICLVASFFIISLMITPAEARCSPTEEFTMFDPNNQSADTCQRCPICPPGEGLTKQCGLRIKNGTFIGCQKCGNGTYSDHYDRSCKSCDHCDLRITERPCTAKQNSICSKKDCKDGYYMDLEVDGCKKIPQTKTSTESTVSSINKPITLKSLLSKSGTPKPTVSIKPAGTAGTVEPVGRNATYSNISTKAVSQPMNSTPDNRLNCAATIGGSLVGALLVIGLITFISVKFNLCRILCCIGREREGLEKGEELPLTQFEADHSGDKPRNESLVRDAIVANVNVMDELARRLDQPDPNSQYWEHLAAEFDVPEDVKMKCQHSLANSPTKDMLDIKEAEDTDFSVQKLKIGLRAISREDLVRKVEKCALSTGSIQELRERYPDTFETICLQLDHHDNWKPLGRNIGIPDETLRQIATSTSCAKTVLEIIEKKNPRLIVKEMQDVLKGMKRRDVCNVLHKYLRDNDTIVTLRANLGCLEKVAVLLDKETQGMKNWLHFARELGVSNDKCDSLKPKGKPSPTRALMKHIVQVNPDLTVKTFMDALEKMQRKDVVSALKELIRAKQDAEDGPNISCPASRNES